MWIKKIVREASETLQQKNQCCFCGDKIKEAIPVMINLDLGDSQYQSMSAHGKCLQDKLHPSVPFVTPDEISEN